MDFKEFSTKKAELSTLLGETSGILSELSLSKLSENLRQLSKRVEKDTFKIQIVGTFKNGKSTFINALLGEKILPARILPCTAVINEVKYGDTKRAVLHFRPDMPETLIDTIPPATLDHMKRHGMKNVPPMEIPYDDIDKYVVIPVDGDPEEISAASPYHSVELFYPSPFLKDGVEIIDSPGLNECDSRTEVTVSYLDHADAIIFLFDSTRACAADEVDMIEDVLLPKGFNEMFFIVNRFDMVGADERDDVRRFVRSKVGHLTPNEIYFISALNAVEGKMAADRAKYDESGMPPFEERLTHFLTVEKGRIKLSQPARELSAMIGKEIEKEIFSQSEQLNMNLEKLRARYTAIQPQLDALRATERNLRNTMNLKIDIATTDIRRAVAAYFRNLQNTIPVWVEQCEVKTSLGMATKKKLKKASEEIMTQINVRIKDNFAKWNKDVLTPLVEEKAKDIFSSTDAEVEGLLKEMDTISTDLSGKEVEVQGASGWERALGAGMCIFSGAAGAGMMIEGFNPKNFFTNLAIDFGIGTGLLLLGVVNPVIAIGAAIVVVWNAVARGQSGAAKKLKAQISDATIKSVLQNADAKAIDVADKLKEKLREVVDVALGSINTRITDTETSMKSTLATLEAGKEETARRKENLKTMLAKAHDVRQRLDNLVFDLAGLKE